MKFEELLDLVGELPVFRSSLLLAGDRDPRDVRRQLTRWTHAGRILQLRRNVYTLARPWRRVSPHPFLVANELHRPSYVSLQSALAYYGLIPEAVPVSTSVTSARPAEFTTPIGRFLYRHVHSRAFFGYRRVVLAEDQEVLLADPAKTLLDLAYLTSGGERADHLESLRLEGLDVVGARQLRGHARRWGKKKVSRAVEQILRLTRRARAEADRR